MTVGKSEKADLLRGCAEITGKGENEVVLWTRVFKFV